MLKKIMIAMDELAASEWAFDLALEMADVLNAELTLIRVLWVRCGREECDRFAQEAAQPLSDAGIYRAPVVQDR